MKIRIVAILWLVATSLMTSLAHAESFDPAGIARIDTYLESELSRGYIPGAAIVLVEGDRIVHVRGFGNATPGGAKVTPSTPFKLGSVSKSITAVAISRLVDEGKIALDAPVRRYLPWFSLGNSDASARITVRELLTHTSGIPRSAGARNFADRDDSDDALERAVRGLSDVDLAHEPGTTFDYSNANYQVLGAIVEAASGQPFATFVNENVFRPLGMSQSFVGARAALPHGAAIGSRYWFGFPIAAPDVPSPKSLEPAGQLYASAEDMGKYLGALLGHGERDGARILSDEATRALFVPTANTRSGQRYAMGWMVTPDAGSFNVWHDGSTPNFHAHAALDLPSRRGFALLVNAESFLSGPVIGDVALQVLRILRDQEPVPVARSFMPPLLFAVVLLVVAQSAGFAWWLKRERAGGRAIPWSRTLIPFVLHLGAAAALVIGSLRTRQTTFRAALLFAPDGAYALAANVAVAVTWASVRLLVLCRRKLVASR